MTAIPSNLPQGLNPRHLAHAIVCLSLLLLPALACRPQPTDGPAAARSLGIERYASARDLYRLAERYRAKHELPSLGVGIVHRGRVAGLGMAGERIAGSGDRTTLDDVFDVASCSKSVTATMAAWLVERGTVRWDTTISEAFPELRDSMHPGYGGATLEQLLRHSAGINHDLNRNARWAGWNRQHAGKSAAEQRFLFAAAALQREPRSAPGTEDYYTSDGYIIAGSMLERAAGVDWEALVRTELFEPLGMETAGYGGVSQDGAMTRVSGHEDGWFGRGRPAPLNPAEYGATPFGAPAGFLYSSVPDLLRYVDFHIQGANGIGRILRRESFERLHAPVEAHRFALGWEIDVKHDEHGRVFERSVYHGGYSGRFRANMWFTPETQWGTVIVMNHGRGDDSISADIFYALLREFGLGPAAHEAE